MPTTTKTAASSAERWATAAPERFTSTCERTYGPPRRRSSAPEGCPSAADGAGRVLDAAEHEVHEGRGTSETSSAASTKFCTACQAGTVKT